VPVSDLVLGLCYLDPQAFLDRARFFGAQAAVAGLTAEDLVPLVAMASRAADAHCGRTFDPSTIFENHRFDLRTRRVSVNQPPVITLQTYQIKLANDLVIEFDVADVVVNNQENYLELTGVSAELKLTGQYLIGGVREPQVEISYLSYQTIHPKVATATGFIAGWMANQGHAAAQLTPGLSKVKLDGAMEVQRDGRMEQAAGEIPFMAQMLLREFVRIAIG
jgi:hypothetical protein